MKKKILVFPIFLLAFAMISIPVMAAPATKIEGVTLTSATTTAYYDGYPRRVSQQIVLSKGYSTGLVTLDIPTVGTLYGTWNSTWFTRNKGSNWPDTEFAPEAECLIQAHVVLNFTDETTTGTFEGTSHRTIVGYPIGPASYFETHMVLHGTGDFRGQTLKSSSEGLLLEQIEETYLIMPNNQN
jgi:hypothetical protein